MLAYRACNSSVVGFRSESDPEPVSGAGAGVSVAPAVDGGAFDFASGGRKTFGWGAVDAEAEADVLASDAASVCASVMVGECNGLNLLVRFSTVRCESIARGIQCVLSGIT